MNNKFAFQEQIGLSPEVVDNFEWFQWEEWIKILNKRNEEKKRQHEQEQKESSAKTPNFSGFNPSAIASKFGNMGFK